MIPQEGSAKLAKASTGQGYEEEGTELRSKNGDNGFFEKRLENLKAISDIVNS
ncbi:hypothetical protein D623_10014372 [Myotis brandtii]|uniref:Uncharacterized protein n=1 Tax=Myotis brandtii TaxID=109478 RepID=S7PRP9_MYOBR|nr:hypothetical protein D623_10014372 [Myotis brandtii]